MATKVRRAKNVLNRLSSIEQAREVLRARCKEILAEKLGCPWTQKKEEELRAFLSSYTQPLPDTREARMLKRAIGAALKLVEGLSADEITRRARQVHSTPDFFFKEVVARYVDELEEIASLTATCLPRRTKDKRAQIVRVFGQLGLNPRKMNQTEDGPEPGWQLQMTSPPTARVLACLSIVLGENMPKIVLDGPDPVEDAIRVETETMRRINNRYGIAAFIRKMKPAVAASKARVPLDT